MSIRSTEIKGVVIFHSGYGHTTRMAEAVAGGAQAELLQIDAEGNLSDEAWAQINAAHYVILGSPTYMGGPSWQFKKFADASSKPWFTDLWKDKVFGGFTNSASVKATSWQRCSTSLYSLRSTAASG